MKTNMYLNLPVKDLAKSTAFFERLGFTINPQFSGETATSMVVNEHIYIMLLQEEFFKTFTKKTISDAHKSTEMLIGLSAETKDEVNKLVDAALNAGGISYNEAMDHGWMYQRSFADLDGHQWEIFYMDLNAMPKQ
ncbi:MAG TPA: VOC family protein [Bacteroidia bacterium]|nr:VOC family protein [Bacteroidia bacterium]